MSLCLGIESIGRFIRGRRLRRGRPRDREGLAIPQPRRRAGRVRLARVLCSTRVRRAPRHDPDSGEGDTTPCCVENGESKVAVEGAVLSRPGARAPPRSGRARGSLHRGRVRTGPETGVADPSATGRTVSLGVTGHWPKSLGARRAAGGLGMTGATRTAAPRPGRGAPRASRGSCRRRGPPPPRRPTESGDRPEGHDRLPARVGGDALRDGEAHRDAEEAAGDRDREGLHHELVADVDLPRAHRPPHPDLARALEHRGQHDVHDPDAAHEERDAGDRPHHDVEEALGAAGSARGAPRAP